MVVEYMLCGNRGLQLVGACEVEKAYACSYLCFAYVTYDTCQRPKICVNLYGFTPQQHASYVGKGGRSACGIFP